MSIYYIKSLDTFTYSISYIVHIIVSSGFKIKHSEDKTIIYNRENTLEISHDTIKKYLSDNDRYKSYNLHVRAYEEAKDRDSDIARRKAEYNLNMINKIIHTYSIKQLFIELEQNNLLTTTIVKK